MKFTYLDNLIEVIKKIDETAVQSFIDCLEDYRNTEKRIFVIGNGGSASLADHFACDLSKTVLGKNGNAPCRFLAESLVSNNAVLTAWANDTSYDVVFSEQLKQRAREGDLLIVISGSGNSKNIIAALVVARQLGMKTFGLLGFGGGEAKVLVNNAIVINSHDYGIVEDGHTIITHLITDWFKQYGKSIS